MTTQRSSHVLVAVTAAGIAAWPAVAGGDLEIVSVSKTGSLTGTVVVDLQPFFFDTPIEVQGLDQQVDVGDSVSQGPAVAAAAASVTTTAIPGGFKVTLEASSSASIQGCTSCFGAFSTGGVSTQVAFELPAATRLLMTGQGVPALGIAFIRLESEAQLWLNEQCDTAAAECPAGLLDVAFDQVLPAGFYVLAVGGVAPSIVDCSPPCTSGADTAISAWTLCVETGDGEPSACPGDTNGDNVVNIDDVVNVILDFGGIGDANGDGFDGDVDGEPGVTIDDVVFVVLQFGSTCP